MPSATLIAQLGILGFVFFMLLNSAAIMVYVERKVAAWIQQRIGPYLVGPWGVMQPLADIIKLMMKEDLRPKAADKILFTLAPIIAATAALTKLKNFRPEYEAHVREGRCTVPAPWRRRSAAPAHSHSHSRT